jgi:uncharacterized protein DUF4145
MPMALDRNLWGEMFSRNAIPAFTCPHCKKGTLKADPKKIKVVEPPYSKKEHSDDAWEPDWIRERFVFAMQCSLASCGEVVIVAGDTQIDQVVQEDGGWGYEQMLRPRAMFPGPPIITLPSDLPSEVDSDVKAAFQLFWCDLDSSASRLRTSVERVLDHFKIPSSKAGGEYLTLSVRIQEFKKIDPDHADTFDALRYVGNVGTHVGELKREALLDAYEIYEDALDELFSKQKHKAKIASLKKKLIAAKGKYK